MRQARRPAPRNRHYGVTSPTTTSCRPVTPSRILVDLARPGDVVPRAIGRGPPPPPRGRPRRRRPRPPTRRRHTHPPSPRTVASSTRARLSNARIVRTRVAELRGDVHGAVTDDRPFGTLAGALRVQVEQVLRLPPGAATTREGRRRTYRRHPAQAVREHAEGAGAGARN